MEAFQQRGAAMPGYKPLPFHEIREGLLSISAPTAEHVPHSSDNTILKSILEQLCRLLKAEGAALLIFDDKNAAPDTNLVYGDCPIMSDAWQMCHHASQIVSPNAARNITRVPLAAEEATIGTLCICRSTPMNEAELRVLTSMSDITANALVERQRTRQEHEQIYDDTLAGWVGALELRDHETREHTQRVTAMTVELARELGIGEQDIVHIRRGALLHDIGKIAVPDYILLKPGALTTEEWNIMREHPQYAYGLLSTIPFLQPALDIPYYHHEQWDGSGYPFGLQKAQIPLAARIFAIIDVWDALRYDRPYRRAWPESRVYRHIEARAGTHFDPDLVPIFLRMRRTKPALFSRHHW
jgi:putative nucleotidyltransferase with HDIG domain